MVYTIFSQVFNTRAVLIFVSMISTLFLEDLFNIMVKITKFNVSSDA